MKFISLRACLLGACLLALADLSASAAECVTPLENLTLWLPLDADANDVINGQQGILSGSPAFAAGKVSQGLNFDGTDNSIRLSASSAVDIGNGPGLTIEMWMNPQDVESPMALLEWSGPGGSQLGLHFYTSTLGSGTLFANLIDTNGGPHHIASAAGLLSQGEFQHVALTYNRASGVAKIFRNGTEVAQADFGNLRLETRAGLWVGKRAAGTNGYYHFSGVLDEVSLYNRALSQAELQAIVDAGATGKCKATVPAPDFDVSRDFSRSSNPIGPWSYGHLETLNGPFTLLPFEKDFFTLNGVAVSGWQVTDSLAPGIYRLMGNSTGISAGGAFTAEPGTMWIFAGNTGTPRNFGVIRFTVPEGRAGSYRIETAVRPVYDGALSADGEFRVSRNGQELFGQFTPANSGTGYSNAIALAAGDTVDFAVGRGVSGLVDRSGLKITATLSLVTNAPPPPPVKYDVSSDFSTGSNPGGPWSYGWKETLAGPLTTLPYGKSLFSENGVPIFAWQLTADELPSVAYVVGPGTAVSAQGQFVAPPGTIYFSAGVDGNPQNFGAVRFTMPAGQSGRYRIESLVRDEFDGSFQGDTDFHVARNGTELFGSFVAPHTVAGYTNELALAAGDAVDFLVGRGQDGHQAGSGLKIQAVLTQILATSGPPSIVTQPASQTVLVGANVSFSVTAEGAAPLTYQWLFDGQPVSAATNPSLTITATTNDAGGYSVIVQNDAGSVTSLVATLTVSLAPPCFPTSAGLAGWWPFEQSGNDLAGGGSAAFTGDPVFVSGKVGDALWLDGVNDTASVPASPQLNVGAADDGFTIEGWIKPGSVGQQALVEWNNRAGTAGVHLWLGQNPPLGGGAGCLYANLVDVNNSSHRMSSVGGLVSTGAWQHVALTYSKSNGVTTIFVNGASVAQQNLGSFTAQTGPGFDLLFGHRIAGGIQFPFKGGVDEMSIYGRALAVSEIQAIVGASFSGKCNAGFPPQIVAGPQSQTVVRGSTVVFTVGASGTAPLSYQWLFNEAPIDGATAATLTLANVQLNQSGNYSVIVSNNVGTAASGAAVLVVNPPPATVRVVNANGAGAAEVSVPVELVANGNENALGFSLNFNASVLGFVGATLGMGAPSDAALLVNTNEVAAGRLGVVVGLPADEVFTEGTQQVALVTFLVAPILNQMVVPVSFGNQPTLKQLSDVHAHVLPSVFVGGTVSIADSQFEGDVAPRPAGDRSVATIDWVQMGRFVARLDTISSSNEFQRADCAPRATKGNGLLTVSDWVQAGRYAVGLDPLTVLGGPTEEDTSGGGGFAAASTSSRQLCLVNTSIPHGQTNVVPVTLECQGNENAVSFSVAFDPAKLAFVSAAPGAGAAGSLLNLNTSEAAQGRLGVALAAQPGRTFEAGVREVLQLRFAALASAPATAGLSFTNVPVPREVSDAAANPLPTGYTAGVVSVTPPPGPPLRITRSGSSLFITWPSSAVGFELEATEGALGTAWSLVPGVIEIGEQKLAIVNIGGHERYFRLKKP